jgi:hypothetical protein
MEEMNIKTDEVYKTYTHIKKHLKNMYSPELSTLNLSSLRCLYEVIPVEYTDKIIFRFPK